MAFNQLTALDFNDIKASIKDYLKSSDVFTDYNFEGSALSNLIDVLAYNTYYTAFNTNFVINEAFLDSATIRDNVVRLAKLLNYTPKYSNSEMLIESYMHYLQGSNSHVNFGISHHQKTPKSFSLLALSIVLKLISKIQNHGTSKAH